MTNTDRPLVTFALFAYNQEKYIREAVEGAFAQTYEPLEITLSDDCSSDRTFEIMQEMAAAYEGPHRVRVRKNKMNVGFAMHINKVVSNANGEIICWAAGDDISIPERTALLVEPMLHDNSIVGTHSPVIRMSIDGQIGQSWHQPHMVKELTKESVAKFCHSVSSQSHAFRTRVFNHFGPLRADLTNEGAPMTFRELEFGKIRFIGTSTVYYRIGTGVSTYSGEDLQQKKVSEPIKIAKWRLSAYRQMLDDFQNMAHKDPYILKEINSNISFYEILLELNMSKPSLRQLFKGISLRKNPMVIVRAYLRSLAPSPLYSLLKRYR